MALGVVQITAVTAVSAHPFGPPLAADVWTDGATVRVRIVAAEDDWVILGHHVGAFSDPAGAALDPDAQLPVTGAEALASAPEVRAYLADHIRVAQAAPVTNAGVGAEAGGAQPCPGEVARLTPALLTEGVELSFRCDELGSGFEVTSTLLTDVHEAYRTAVRGVDTAPSRALLTAAQPTVRLLDDPSATSPVSSAPALLIVVGVAVMAAGIVLLVRRGGTGAHDDAQVGDEVAA